MYTVTLPTYGHLMTIQEFKQCVKSRGFIDYDGNGKAVKDNLATKKNYSPSEVNDIPEDATHFLWFNR